MKKIYDKSGDAYSEEFKAPSSVTVFGWDENVSGEILVFKVLDLGGTATRVPCTNKYDYISNGMELTPYIASCDGQVVINENSNTLEIPSDGTYVLDLSEVSGAENLTIVTGSASENPSDFDKGLGLADCGKEEPTVVISDYVACYETPEGETIGLKERVSTDEDGVETTDYIVDSNTSESEPFAGDTLTEDDIASFTQVTCTPAEKMEPTTVVEMYTSCWEDSAGETFTLLKRTQTDEDGVETIDYIVDATSMEDTIYVGDSLSEADVAAMTRFACDPCDPCDQDTITKMEAVAGGFSYTNEAVETNQVIYKLSENGGKKKLQAFFGTAADPEQTEILNVDLISEEYNILAAPNGITIDPATNSISVSEVDQDGNPQETHTINLTALLSRVVADDSLIEVSSETEADGGFLYKVKINKTELAKLFPTFGSNSDIFTVTAGTGDNGQPEYTLDVVDAKLKEFVHQNQKLETVTSNDDTVEITESTNTSGGIEYDLTIQPSLDLIKQTSPTHQLRWEEWVHVADVEHPQYITVAMMDFAVCMGGGNLISGASAKLAWAHVVAMDIQKGVFVPYDYINYKTGLKIRIGMDFGFVGKGSIEVMVYGTTAPQYVTGSTVNAWFTTVNQFGKVEWFPNTGPKTAFTMEADYPPPP